MDDTLARHQDEIVATARRLLAATVKLEEMAPAWPVCVLAILAYDGTFWRDLAAEPH